MTSFNDNLLPNQGITFESSWLNPKTTVEIIDTLVKKGVKTLRIPVVALDYNAGFSIDLAALVHFGLGKENL